MTEDERRNKILAENHFYLELRYKHDGNFEAMLNPDELTIWNRFPNFHKQFFTYFSGQEWEIVSSLRCFSDKTVIGKVNGRPVTKADKADMVMQTYQQHRKQNNTTLKLYELHELLYPLCEFSGDLLKQEVADALYLHATDPDIAEQRDTQEWQQYGVNYQPIPLAWLEKQENEYLRYCATVWRSYLSTINKTSINTPDGLQIPWLMKKVQRKRGIGEMLEVAYKAFRKSPAARNPECDELWLYLTPENLPEFISRRDKDGITLIESNRVWTRKDFMTAYPYWFNPEDSE